MLATAKVDASALYELLRNPFDEHDYERGRKDVRVFSQKCTQEQLREKYEETQAVIQGGDYRHRVSPSYWVGCLAEFSFVPLYDITAGEE